MAQQSDPQLFEDIALHQTQPHFNRYSRIEWPTANPIVRGVLDDRFRAADEKSVSPDIVRLIRDEVERCNPNVGYIPDYEILAVARALDIDWKGILLNLYVRARRQSTIWDIYQHLVDRGYLRKHALTLPMNTMHISKHVNLLSCAIRRFPFVREAVRRGYSDWTIPYQHVDFTADIDWLATMIIRSGIGIYKLWECLQEGNFLGEGDEATLRELEFLYPTEYIQPNPREGGEIFQASGSSNQTIFGFWLPHGLSGEPGEFERQLEECLDRFETIERAFMEVERSSIHLQ